MRCPLKNDEIGEVLLDYCARKLTPEVSAEVGRHVQTCPECTAFCSAQERVWTALDDWAAPPVSENFARELYDRIDRFENKSWVRRLVGERFARRPALSLGAACTALVLGLMVRGPVNQPVVSPVPAAPHYQEASRAELEPEQVEQALEDLEMLKQLSVSSTQNL
jgi:anti-sigma factor RsiW